MENRPPSEGFVNNPEDDDDEEEKSKDKKEYGLFKGLFRRDEAEKPADIPEKPDEDESEQPQLFSELLGVKEPEEATEEPETSEVLEVTPVDELASEVEEEIPPLPEYEDADFEEELSPVSAPDMIEASEETPEESEEEAPTSPSTPRTPLFNWRGRATEDAAEAPEDVPSTPIVHEAAPETPVTEAVEADAPEEPAEVIPDDPDTPEDDPVVEHGGAVPPLPDLDPGATVGLPVPEVQVPPVVVNRGHGADVLLGAGLVYEHLRTSKKAKEAEKRDKAQQEQIDNLKKTQLNQEYANQQLKQNLERQHKKQEVVPSAPERVVAAVKTSEKAPEAPQPQEVVSHERNKAEALPEVPKPKTETVSSVGDIIAERNQAKIETQEVIPATANFTRLDPESLLKPELSEKSSELLLHQTEAAAELNVAQEKQYELRHEVKDVATTPLGAGGLGAPIQSGVTGSGAEGQTTLLSGQTLAGTKLTGHTDEKPHPSSDQYKQAMKAGLWTALVIITAVVIWMIST